MFSERLHLKAIEVVIYGFSPKVKLIQHLFSSYKKNYNFNLIAIQEEDEHSVSTLQKSDYFDIVEDNVSHMHLKKIGQMNHRLSEIINKKHVKMNKT